MEVEASPPADWQPQPAEHETEFAPAAQDLLPHANGTAAPRGPDTTRREVIVRFRDASAGDVRIAGDFNGWVPDKGVRSLIESEGHNRVWTKILMLAPGTYQYRYVVDGEWREDPTNPESGAGPTGEPNSILNVR